MEAPAEVSSAARRGTPVQARSGLSSRPVPSGRLSIMALLIEDVPEIEPATLERASRVIRVLGHPLRLRILNLLEGAERNVTQLVLATGVGQAAVSQQLRILRSEGIVDDRRDGSRVFYRITEPKVSRILDCIRACDVPDIRALADADWNPGPHEPRVARGDSEASRPTRVR